MFWIPTVEVVSVRRVPTMVNFAEIVRADRRCGNYCIARGLCRECHLEQQDAGGGQELHVVVGAICSTKHIAKYGQSVQVKYDLYQQVG